MTLTFTVLGVAAPQGSMRACVTKSGRAFVRPDNARTLPWRQEVAAVADRARLDASNSYLWPTNDPVLLRVTFFLPRPAGHLGRKGLRPSAPRFPSKKPDLSKLVRAAEDALTGIVFEDDARIVRHDVQKLYADAPYPPRAVFEVEVLS